MNNRWPKTAFEKEIDELKKLYPNLRLDPDGFYRTYGFPV
jgi:hypothetical protein